MSVPTAELTAPAVTAPRVTPGAGLARSLAGGRLYLVLAAAALLLGALSLLIPSTPSYDPWSWLVWGREIIHLDLHTTGGPSWKPLPAIFTTVFALFGKAAPDLWLVVARAGALLAVAMTFKIAWRVTAGLTERLRDHAGEPRSWRLAPALIAGAIAAASLVNSRGFITDNALGYSEGLMTALVLIALDRHLDGARRQAFAVGFGAALDRPELWLLWGPYGIYLWWKDPGARKLVAVLFGLIPILWFLPELWGSGHLLRGVNRAQHPRSNSPAFAKCPFCTELSKHAWPTVMFRVKALGILAMAAAAVGLSRARGRWREPWGAARITLVIAGLVGFGWWTGIALETQAGFSGNDRYLVLGVALVALAGGVGWGWAAHWVAKLWLRLSRNGSLRNLAAPALASAIGALAVLVVLFAMPPWFGPSVVDIPATHRALVYQAHLRSDMTRAVDALGGSGPILRCGKVMTEGFQVPMLAWNLGVHTLDVEASPLPNAPLPPPPNVIFQARAQRHSKLLPVVTAWRGVGYRLVAHVRTFRVYSRCTGKVAL